MQPIGAEELRLFRSGRDALKCYYSVSSECKSKKLDFIYLPGCTNDILYSLEMGAGGDAVREREQNHRARYCRIALQ